VRIEAPRGTLDVLPSEQPTRDAIVEAAEDTARRYAYGRIVTPTFEDSELFARTSGQGSDVVTKEMYTFRDRSDRSLTLRPEATAGICRAFVEHGLHRLPQPVKTFTIGPMFRYAAPQKGRYREFWQVDFEAIGSDDPAVDAELIQLFVEIERRLGIKSARLELNSIGDRTCRPAYVERLGAWLAEHHAELDDEAREKARTSPLRVFDTKSAGVREALTTAPTIGESLCADCRDHFAEVRGFLDAYRIEYELVPTLVRGLDYYTRTVWEFVDDGLGAAQSSICAGGRYDYLVEEIGGPPTPAVGWAAGVERLRMSMGIAPEPSRLDVFFAFEDRSRRAAVVPFMAHLRAEGVSCDTDYAARSLKGQLTQAQRLFARRIAIVPAEGDRWTVREAGQLDREVPPFETSAFVP
jgi:histidyl-tRNA synthetase